MSNNGSNFPSAFLFDIGNVLIDTDTNRAFEYWSTTTGVDVDTLRDRFVMDDAYHDFKTGKIDTHEYLRSLRQLMNIDIDQGDLLNGWNAILCDEIHGMQGLLQRLKEIAPIYLWNL